MSNELRFNQLIEHLIHKTHEGKIFWEPTPLADRFITSISGKYSIAIEELEPKSKYVLSIRDLRGREVVRIGSWNPMKHDNWTSEWCDEYDERVKELFDLVHKIRNLEVQVAVEDVVKTLDVL